MTKPSPRLQSYVAGLPEGLASYPRAVTKASILAQLLEHSPCDCTALELPDEIRAFVTGRLRINSWIPESHANAAYLAIADAMGLDDDGVVDHWLAVNRSLLAGPIYRVTMRMMSPSLLLTVARSRWGTFHRGITLELEKTDSTRYRTRMGWPAHLVPRLLARAYCTALRAAVEMASASDVAVDLIDYRPDGAAFDVRWS